MALKGYFFNALYNSETQTYDREYDADAVNQYLSALVSGGVIPNPSTNLQVTTVSNMDIAVLAGQMFWPDGHKMVNEAAYPLTVTGGDTLYARIDRVVGYIDYVNRVCGLEVKEGTPAASPVAPDLIRDQNRYEYSLATITVGAGATSLSLAAITDTRADSEVCGWVTGLIQQVDTSTLFQQWQAAYEEYYTESTADFEAWEASMRSAFDTWLHDLTDELNVDTYVNEYEKTANFTSADTTKVITLDWAGYEYENTDIINAYINGLLADSGTDYTLDTTGTNPTVTFSFTGSSLTDVCRVQVIKSIIGFDTTP